MAKRVVEYRLSAQVADFNANMKLAAKNTRETATEAQLLSEKIAAQRTLFDATGKAAMGLGVAMLAGVGMAVSKAADFNQAMSNVKATGQDAVDSFGALREAALEAGADTVFSATESANAIEEMAKAGVDAKDILGGGLKGALDLAAAGELGVADAAGTAAVALKTFNLEGSDMGHVADLLAAGAGKAMGDVSALSAALAQGGQVAAATGLSIEETTAALASFASQGLLGSDAGTSLKTMLQRLTPQSDAARTQFEALGISAYDSAGEFVGLSSFAGQLAASMADLTPEARNAAMSVMFGSDAVRAANVLYKEGEGGIRDWIAAVDDQGYAARTAETRLDNLKGDLEALGGAFDTLMISMGDSADGPLRGLIQGLTELVDWFNEIPKPMQDVIFWTALIGGGLALVAGAALLAVPKIAEFRLALQTLNMTGARVKGGLGGLASFLGGPWGVALAVAAAAMVVFNKAIEEGVPSQEQITNSIVSSTNAMDGLMAAAERGGLEKFWAGDYTSGIKELPGLLDRAADAVWRWGDLTFADQGSLDSIKKYGESLAGLAATDLPAAQGAFRDLVEAQKLTDEQAIQLLNEMPAYRDYLTQQARATGGLAGESDQLAAALGEVDPAMGGAADAAKTATQTYLDEAGAVSSVVEELNELVDAINQLNGVGQDAISKNIAYQDSIRDIDEHLKKVREGAEGFAMGLDITTDAGSRNKEQLNGMAQASQDAAKAQFDLDQNTEAYRVSLEEGRQRVVDYARALGATAEDAEVLAKTIYTIPTDTEWKLIAETASATADIDRFIERFGTLSGTINYRAQLPDLDGVDVSGSGRMGTFYQGGIVEAFASGGFPSGIYQGVQGGIHKFAEAEMGVPWEAYISGRPSDRDKNIGHWVEAGQRLGVSPGGGGGQTVSIKNEIHAQPGMSADQIAAEVAERQAFSLKGA